MKKFIIVVLIFFFNCFSLTYAATLDEKISQMIIIGFDGNNVKSREFKHILKDIDQVSGVILFNKNIDNAEELNKMTSLLKEKSKITPFIAIDNEGGKVLRFNFLDVKSSYEIAKMSDEDAKKEYDKLAKSNCEAGINLNFAPVVDLAINKDSIIVKKERAYSDDYRVVSKYAQILIDEHSKYKIATALKHFPGHGSAKGDTHLGFVDSTEVFNIDELKPYYLLKDNDKTTMVMVSHIFNKKFDTKYPASLSKRTVTDLLKDFVGFKGVVISDDYDMGAIRNNYSLDEIIVLAVNSGIDIMIFSNNINFHDKNIHKKIHKIIKREIKRGNIKEEDIDKSYQKIMEFKKFVY